MNEQFVSNIAAFLGLWSIGVVAFTVIIVSLKKLVKPSIDEYKREKAAEQERYEAYVKGYTEEHGYPPPPPVKSSSSSSGDFATGFILGNFWH